MLNGIHTSVIKDITTLLHIKAFNFGWFGSWQIFSQFVLKTMQGLLSSVVNLSMQYCSTFAVQAPIKTKLRFCICLYFRITFPVVVT